MDEEERIRMAESGVDSEEYKLFLEVNLCIITIYIITILCCSHILLQYIAQYNNKLYFLSILLYLSIYF